MQNYWSCIPPKIILKHNLPWTLNALQYVFAPNSGIQKNIDKSKYEVRLRKEFQTNSENSLAVGDSKYTNNQSNITFN